MVKTYYNILEKLQICVLTMATELGLDSKASKRAGLLHDIGKVPEDNAETPHDFGNATCRKIWRENLKFVMLLVLTMMKLK